MHGFKKSKEIILNEIRIPGTEVISVRESLGRVIAEEIRIPRDYPEYRTSAVDGYAVRFGDTPEFTKTGVIAAGDIPDFAFKPGQCAAVMTGGIVPDRTDSIVMVENCTEREGKILTGDNPEPGAYINEPGTEAAGGSVLLKPGRLINHIVYPVLYYAGISALTVYRRPVIGLLTTGNEVQEIEDKHIPGRVFNTNEYILESFLNSIGLDLLYKIQIPDNEEDTFNELEALAEKCDFVVSSGGISMGRFDYIKKVFHEKDFSLLIDGTSIKPGRPLIFAERNGSFYFGLPGYPASFLTNIVLYLLPALKKASGRSDYDHKFFTARLSSPMSSRKGKMYFNRAILEISNGEWTARGPGSQKTSHFLNFSNVNGLVLMPESVGDLETGSMVQVLHFNMCLS